MGYKLEAVKSKLQKIVTDTKHFSNSGEALEIAELLDEVLDDMEDIEDELQNIKMILRKI
jgi:hypothetical protein